jgi:hypothetical protein
LLNGEVYGKVDVKEGLADSSVRAEVASVDFGV